MTVPAGLTPHSPSDRSTRSHAGRFEGAGKYAGQLLDTKLFKAASPATILARAGFR